MKGKNKLIRNWMIGLFLMFLVLLLIVGLAMPKTSTEKGVSPTPTSETKIMGNIYLVTKVIDGDTLMVRTDGKEESVRLIGINAPESGESGGQEATEGLKNLVENKEVRLESDESQENLDIYGRLLRYVFVNEDLINQKMIENGLVKEYTYKTAYKYQTEFKKMQTQAKENKVGIWSEKVKGVSTQTSDSFICNCGKTCTEISSCEEAYFQLNTCGCSKRDSDDDGVPCESLCR